MHRFVLTGAPGSGKTAILRQLEIDGLALHLGHPIGQALTDELNRIRDEQIYERRVFFIKGQGFITPTPARRITLPDAQQFERLHAEVYSSLGYDLVTIEPGPLDVRAAQVRALISLTHGDDDPYRHGP